MSRHGTYPPGRQPCHDREVSIATENLRDSVVTENSLSRLSSSIAPAQCQRGPCRNRKPLSRHSIPYRDPAAHCSQRPMSRHRGPCRDMQSLRSYRNKTLPSCVQNHFARASVVVRTAARPRARPWPVVRALP